MDQNQRPPQNGPFSRQPSLNRQRGQTGRLPALGGTGNLPPQKGQAPPPPGQAPRPGSPPPPPGGQRSQLENGDSLQMSGQVGPGRKEPPPVVAQNLGESPLGPGIAKVSTLEDGAKVVRYTQPQKLTRLLKDAKANIGGEDSRFYGKGWVIGNQIAKIAADGMSVIYYPQDISDLVRDLLGPDSETL